MTAASVDVLVGKDESQRLADLVSALEGAARVFAQMQEHVFPAVMPILREAAVEAFAHIPYRQLSARYAALKATRYGGSDEPLVRTGAFKAGLTQDSSPFAQRRISKRSLTYGTQRVPYASFLKLEIRPDAEKLEAAADEALTRALAAADSRELLEVERSESGVSG